MALASVPAGAQGASDGSPPAAPPAVEAPPPSGGTPPAAPLPTTGTNPSPATPPGSGVEALPPLVVTVPPPSPPAPPRKAAPEKKPAPPKPETAAAAKPAPPPAPPAPPSPPKTSATATAAPPPSTTPVASAAPPSSPALESSFSAPPAGLPLSPGGTGNPAATTPGSIASVSARDIARTGAATPEDALAATVPGVVIADEQGNPFQTDVQYRGFSASPVDGVPQGLAVYQGGVRINEAFGDTVNWDFLPKPAIADITVVTGNPAYGLNALGGAVIVRMKDGLGFQGLESDTRVGSFGRVQESIEGGQRSGPFAAYAALEVARDDGYRTQGSSLVRRFYGDLGYKDARTELHLNLTTADNVLGASSAAPFELLAQDWSAIYTSPQSSESAMQMLSLNAKVRATDTLSLAGTAYVRHYDQAHIDGNVSSAADCGTGFLCVTNVDGSTVPLVDLKGNPIPNPAPGGGAIIEIDRTNIVSHSYGGTLEGSDTSKLFGLKSRLTLGASLDRGVSGYGATAEIGSIDSSFLVDGSGAIVANSDLRPVGITATNTYYGLYAADTLSLTSRLALTLGARYNIASIRLADSTGTAPSLNATATWQRLNPAAGLTYELARDVTLFAAYSEANRVPVAAELACADPSTPCLVPAFLTSDPALRQIVSHTWEAGVRGTLRPWGPEAGAGRLGFGLSLFRTLSTDDIVNGYSTVIGRSFVINGSTTQRQGLEARLSYETPDLLLYMTYAYIDATFESTLTLSSPNNPLNPMPGNDFPLVVSPGNALPGIPRSRFKAGFDYKIIEPWKVGADLTAIGSQVYFGDEANLNRRLPGYATVNLHSSYDLARGIEVYGLINNLFDQRYATYGTYFDTTAVGSFSDPRSVVPAPPRTFYAGLKLKF